jgi:hypothetical protein
MRLIWSYEERMSEHRKFRAAGRGVGLIAGLCGLLVYALFAFHGEEGLARAGSVSLAVLLVVGYVSWDFRRLGVYWVLMASLAVAHLLILVFLPWDNQRIPGAVVIPFGLLDFALGLFCAYTTLKKHAS